MRTTAIVLALLVGFTGFVAVAPAAEAAPPNIPPGSSGCGFFHYHGGDLTEGELPRYHYHHCI